MTPLMPQLSNYCVLISKCLSMVPVIEVFVLLSRVSNYLTFQSFGYDRTWWCFFQKRVMRINFDIYVFYCNESSLLYIWNRKYVKVLLCVSVVNWAGILLTRPMICVCPSYDAGQMLILFWLYLDKLAY
jgi:hypothetical protein